MTLGFFVAALAVVAAADGQGVVCPVIILFAVAFPIVDTTTAIARRWIRGVPFSVADRRHIHHQLQYMGLTVPQTVINIWFCFSFAAALGLVFVFVPDTTSTFVLIAIFSLITTTVLSGLHWQH